MRLLFGAIAALALAPASAPANLAPGPDLRVPPLTASPGGSRLRVAGRSVITPALLGASAALVIPYHDDLATASRLDRSPLDAAMDLGNAYGDGKVLGGAAAGLLLIGALGPAPREAAAGRDLVESFAIAWPVVWALKVTVREERPDGGPYSFPSGHTATAFAAAPVLARHYGSRVGAVAYAAATMTALGRMEERRHHLQDVLAGAAIGIVAGRRAAGGPGPSRELTIHRNGLALEFDF